MDWPLPIWRLQFRGKLSLTPLQIQQRKLTKAFIQLLLLNTVFPFLFHYYKYTGDGRVDQILDWVRQLPPEKNSYSLKFKELGCTIKDALESQASIQLKTNYCNPRRCLSCSFGHKLLNLWLLLSHELYVWFAILSRKTWLWGMFPIGRTPGYESKTRSHFLYISEFFFTGRWLCIIFGFCLLA